MRPLANIELNPTKPKMNPKKPDQIRSMMAYVGAEPERVTRAVMNARVTPPFWNPRRAWEWFKDLPDTGPHS